MFAVVVRRLIRVTLGKEHTLKRREARIPKEQAALRVPNVMIESLGLPLRWVVHPFSETSEFDAFVSDIESMGGQTTDYLFELEESAFRRRHSGNSPPITCATGNGRAVMEEGGQVVGRIHRLDALFTRLNGS
jgi:hypothetical protein